MQSPGGVENYHLLKKRRNQELIRSSKSFLPISNRKIFFQYRSNLLLDHVFHNRYISTSGLGSSISSLIKVCQHLYADARY